MSNITELQTKIAEIQELVREKLEAGFTINDQKTFNIWFQMVKLQADLLEAMHGKEPPKQRRKSEYD